MVRRIFVEKKTGFDVESQKLFKDLKENLHLQGITNVRLVNRYDVDGIKEETYQSAKHTVFSEPAVDRVTEETLDVDTGCFSFAVEYLPGQYDQRADSAVQCIRMIDPAAQAVVRFARVYIIEGTLSEAEKEKVKHYCVNPVDSREARLEKPETLEMKMDVPEAVEVVCEFTSWRKQQIAHYREEMGFAMSEEDLLFVQSYFREEERQPTVTELRVIDTYWSDHCRHTTFMTEIEHVTFADGPYGRLVKEAYEDYLKLREEVYGERVKEKEVCLMDMAVIGAKYLKKQGLCQEIDESEEINACSIKVKAKIDGQEEDWLVMFKNETHNHPTEIEPFGGAATCLGGAIRDPLSGRVLRISGHARHWQR